MGMKSNGLLKWVVIPVIGLVCIIAIKLSSRTPSSDTQAADPSTQLTEEERKTLGVGADTPHDTVATLVSQTRALRNEVESLVKQNKEANEENQRLRAREKSVDERIASTLQQERQKSQQERQAAEEKAKSLFQSLKSEIATSPLNPSNAQDLPVGLGLNPDDGKSFNNGADEGFTWVEPQDGPTADSNGSASKPGVKGANPGQSGFGFPNSFNGTTDRAQRELQAEHVQKASTAKKRVKPVYTIPQNSTLMGSVSMTALIGRVPVDGTVNDPYPFKVLIGPDNLTANGIDLPDVAGAVVSGTSSGDWTLSCVRGQIKSITFVFNDGTVRTLPTPEDAEKSAASKSQQASNSSANKEQIQGGMGWISDPYGIPCISGDRRSNAKEYIGNQTLITAAGAGFAALLSNSDDSSSTSVISGNGTTLGTTSMTGNQAVGSILQSGVSDISDWVNKLYGQAFAAVYVKPGAKVAIHIDQQLTIDYELEGRKVKYPSGVSHVSRLD